MLPRLVLFFWATVSFLTVALTIATDHCIEKTCSADSDLWAVTMVIDRYLNRAKEENLPSSLQIRTLSPSF